MGHKVNFYDVAAGFDADGRMRPVRIVETDDADLAIELAVDAVARAGSISAAGIKADWRLCASLAEWFRLENAIGHWLEANPIEGSWIGRLTEDLDHWREMGVETPEQIEKHLLLASWSDTFKDVNGFRPRSPRMTMETPIEEIEAAFDALLGKPSGLPEVERISRGDAASPAP